jgi:hypothetical protein
MPRTWRLESALADWGAIEEWLESALDDLPPHAETLLISLLDNSEIQRVAERVIDGLPEEVTGRLVDVVQNAIDHISSPALRDKLGEFAENVGIELMLVAQNSTDAEVFTGMSGAVDHFVFNTQQPNTESAGAIDGFESLLNSNVIEDLPPEVETTLLNLLDNPALQSIVERVVESLPEEVSGLLGGLVQHVIDWISSPVLKEGLTEFAENVGIELPPDLVGQNSTSAEPFTDMLDIAHHFVFNKEQSSSDFDASDTIVGLEGLWGSHSFEPFDSQLGSSAPMTWADYFFT